MAVKKAKAAAKKAKAASKKVAKTKKTKLATIKTVQSNASVEGFINKIPDEQKRKDSFTIIEMMRKVTKCEPKLWGTSIIAFGNKIYTSPATGRQVEWFYMGFAPRKANLTLYLTVGIQHFPEALKKLGKHKTGGGCLYINKLSDVDLKVLSAMMVDAYKKNKA